MEQLETSVPIETTAETQIENEDFKWTTSRKGWPKYWASRLAKDKENLPKNIQELVERSISKKHVKNRGGKTAELARYVTKMLDGINRGIAPETIIWEEKEKELAAVKKEEESLNRILVWSEQVNESMLDQKLLPLLSEQERKDMAATGKTKGNAKYWLKRLTPEVDILPDDIKNTVKEFISTGKTPQDLYRFSRFTKYIDRRTAILAFQAEKRGVVSNLKNTLKAIDQKEDFGAEEQKSRKTCNYENGLLFVEENGERKPISLGDIVADLEWGIKYRPDDSLPPALWRKIRKLSAIKEARQTIENIFNMELTRSECVTLPTSSWTVDFLENHPNAGPVAERMAQSIISRVQYNNPELGIELEHSNALEDAILKYDFKVLLPIKKRGVAIEGNETSRAKYIQEKKRLGVQFTIRKHAKGKQKQIIEAKSKVDTGQYAKYIKKPVDDIVLAKLPLKTYSECFKKWLESGKTSGGPEQYLSRGEKIKILTAATKDEINFSEEELAKIFPKTLKSPHILEALQYRPKQLI